MPGFPGLEQLNTLRIGTYEAEKHSVSAWLGHKAVSVIALPANGIAIAAGCATMAASACTLGAVKVVLLFVSLGKWNDLFSTGIPWLGERTQNSTYHLFANLWELIIDGCEIADKGVHAIHQAAMALKIDHLVKELFRLVERAAKFVGERIAKGVVAVKEDEEKSPKFSELPLIDSLDTYTRGEFHKYENQYLSIFNHQLVSLIHIPTNLIVGSLATAALLGTLGLSAAKVALVATTGLHVPVPLGVESFAKLAGNGFWNTVRNTSFFVADYPILLYKVSESIGVTNALYKVGKCVGLIWNQILN